MFLGDRKPQKAACKEVLAFKQSNQTIIGAHLNRKREQIQIISEQYLLVQAKLYIDILIVPPYGLTTLGVDSAGFALLTSKSTPDSSIGWQIQLTRRAELRPNVMLS